MAGGPTADGLDYLANLMTTGETPVNSYFIALVPDFEPGFSSTGESITEPQFDEYYRVEIINESSAWLINNGSLSNNFEVTFPPAIGIWGTIRYWAVCDEITGGRVFWAGEFVDQLYVDAGGVVTCDPGTFTLWFEGNQWSMEQ